MLALLHIDQTNTINTNLPIVAASSGSNVLSVNRNKRLKKGKKEEVKQIRFYKFCWKYSLPIQNSIKQL